MYTEKFTIDTVKEFISDWPEQPRETAERIVKKYGPPNEATDSMLIWRNNGPWKKSILYRDEVQHNFPKPHKDVLEQVIDYKVPADKFDDLAKFDGSVIVERTKGEIAARCDREKANFLALNLAHDIITDKRTVDDARMTYAEKIVGVMMDKSDPYTEKLQFQVPTGDTGFPDEIVIDDMLKEKVKNKLK